MVFVGIDWAEKHHDVCIIDEEGVTLAKGRVAVSNVFNGFTVARPAFRRAFGETIASLILGNFQPASAETYPAAPLLSLIEKRADQTACKRDFYRGLGTSQQALRDRRVLVFSWSTVSAVRSGPGL